MSYRMERERDRDRAAGPGGVAPLGWVAAGLALVLGALGFARSLPVDLRWCGPLASACLNVFIVAIGVRLAEYTPPIPKEPLSWRVVAKAIRLAVRPKQDTAGWNVLVHAIHWQRCFVPACACLSFVIAASAFRPLLPAALNGAQGPGAIIAGAVAPLILGFVTLVAERFYTRGAERSRVSASLAQMLRVVLLIELAAAAGAAWLAATQIALDWPVHAAALLSCAIAIELAIRAALSDFLSPRSRANAARVPASLLAGMLRRQPSPFAVLCLELRTRYGIDLRQNWVLQTFLRQLPATVVVMGLCAWLLTAVVVLDPDQRAVYERFGAPAAVWQPGPHVGMPWPFGKARIVDNGAVHQLVVSGSAEDSSVGAPSVSADDATPAQLNRLWDVQHPWETTQVIAGASGGQQNFQIVNADVRLDYRVGLTDVAARAALYRAVDPAGTVRSVANREVVHYLASHTLQSLLETRQTAMADSVRYAVQTQLDRLNSGIEVVAVVIESVHPPAGAAAAWHGVQAAQIRAQASVAQARGFAASMLGDAQQRAIGSVAQASARASDTVSSARVQQIDFDADMVAYRLGGPAFPFEYYLSRLQKGLQNARITVIDDRLIEGTHATLDLRSYRAGDLAGLLRGN
ncbi:protease modulator HflK [Paraburkholderia phymatum]|uniref:protease modulator HflK n=1 Tax=Paraburkholderia phymatum TaxID=148447 RepID=UPI0031787BAE